jgi:hypothetical protein
MYEMHRAVELPEAVYKALEEAARVSGTTAADWIAARLLEISKANGVSFSAKEDWLDRDFLKTYAMEADDSVSLEEVRHAMAKIPGCLAADIRTERDEH